MIRAPAYSMFALLFGVAALPGAHAAAWRDVPLSLASSWAGGVYEDDPCRNLLVPAHRMEGRAVSIGLSEAWPQHYGQALAALVSQETEGFVGFSGIPGPHPEAMDRILEAGLLVNHSHGFSAMADLYVGVVTPERSTVHLTYERGDRLRSRGARSQVFENFRATRLWAAQDRTVPTMAQLLETNVRLTQNLGFPREAGTLRDFAAINSGGKTMEPQSIYENDSSDKVDQVDATQLANLEQGGYCMYRTLLSAGMVERRLRARERISGQIVHPGLESLTPTVRTILEKRDPELIARIQKFEAGRISRAATIAGLERAIVTRLTEDALEKFIEETRGYWALGPESPRIRPQEMMYRDQIYEYVTSVVKLYQNLVAIHPFTDANGRTLRVGVLYRLIEAVGLPTPRLANLDEDILLSLHMLRDRVMDGILQARDLNQDIATRSALGLPWQRSPLLLFPGLPDLFDVTVGSTTSALALDRTDFARWFQRSPPEGWRRGGWPQVIGAYMTHLGANTWRPHHYLYPGQQHRSTASGFLPLVDEEAFAPKFLASHHGDAVTRSALLSRYYNSNLVYRGLSYEGGVSTKDMLRLFTDINDHLMSNGLRERLADQGIPMERDNPDFQRLLRREIRDHNRRLLADEGAMPEGPLPSRLRMVEHHVKGDDRSALSPWMSTADSMLEASEFTVAVSDGPDALFYTKGAQGVLLGMRSPRWALSTYALAARYSSFAVAEGEELVPGVIHPDAVMFAAHYVCTTVLDGEGGGRGGIKEVRKVMLRNPRDPAEVLIFTGDAARLVMDELEGNMTTFPYRNYEGTFDLIAQTHRADATVHRLP